MAPGSFHLFSPGSTFHFHFPQATLNPPTPQPPRNHLMASFADPRACVCEFNLPPNLYEYFVCVWVFRECRTNSAIAQPPLFFFVQPLPLPLTMLKTASVSAFSWLFVYHPWRESLVYKCSQLAEHTGHNNYGNMERKSEL